MNTQIYVYADWSWLQEPTLVGVLSVTHTKGKAVFMFAYDEKWLSMGQAQHLDPDLQFYGGPQFPKDAKNFGMFLDSAPDRWGEVLMRRREALIAKQEKRKAKTLSQEDYLLGVFDEHRIGGLRFKLDRNGEFLNNNKELASPPMTSLRELEQASLQLENEALKDKEALKWLNMLMAPGASLGGARPKASVADEKKHLWIAKFPSVNDPRDIGAWEMVIYELAKHSGINMADAMLKKFNNKHHTFLNKRFDRIKGKRIHFASAMTLLGQSDHRPGASYMEIAEFISRFGSNPKEDLVQLWRRIVFNILVSNTDDHLRNHGFLLSQTGWSLSPAYDVNPIPDGAGLQLNISEDDNSLDVDLARSVAAYFRVEDKTAKKVIIEIQAAVGKWKTVATKLKIPKAEQELIEPAFKK